MFVNNGDMVHMFAMNGVRTKVIVETLLFFFFLCNTYILIIGLVTWLGLMAGSDEKACLSNGSNLF